MPSAQKNNKAMSRPLPSSLAPGDANSTDLGGYKQDKTSIVVSNSAKVSEDKVAKSKAPFRYTWQKKGRFAYQEALIESENADRTEDKVKQRGVSSKQSDAGDHDGAESSNGGSIHATTVGKQCTGIKRPLGDGENYDDEESDVEFKQEDSDGDYEGATASKKHGGSHKKQKYQMKAKTPDPNGRVLGRKLVMWHRPHMVDKLMLHLQYECHRDGIKLPWDKVVERLSPGSSGQSALQHLNKLRDILISEGHMVPPLLGKATVLQDPTVRGYVRDMDADKPTDARVVRWGEHIEDRKENLQDVGVVRGSGNYRRAQMASGHQRGLAKALEKTQQATGTRRNRLPVELRLTGTASNGTAGAGATAVTIKKEKINKKQTTRAVSSRAESPDPAELASDEEYDPSANKKKGKLGRLRRRTVTKYKVENSDDEAVEEVEEEESIHARVSVNTPQNKRLKGHGQREGLMTPPATTSKTANSLIVKMKLRPDLLRRLASRPISTKKEVLKGEISDDENHGDDMEDSIENISDYGAEDLEDEEGFEQYDTPIRQKGRQISVHPFALDIIQQRAIGGYQGFEEHGTLTQYKEAIKNGTDPSVNGLKCNLSSAGSERVERQTSADYKLVAPSAYTSPYPSHGPNAVGLLGGSFDGSSASALFGNHNGRDSPIAMTGMRDLLLDEMMGGMGDNPDSSVRYGQGAEHMDDPFFDGHNNYASGSRIFQNGSTTFSASGLSAVPHNNDYHGQPGTPAFELNVDGYFDLNSSSDTLASSSASGFLNSTDGTTTVTANDLAIHDDAVSLARSSPAPYAAYIHDHAHDDKENQEWMEYF